MRNDILTKLSSELEVEITAERQVVYILVEARKLLEQQGTLEKFRTLKLCADWAVHPKLDRSDAQVVLKRFDAFEMEHRKSGVTVAEFQSQALRDFLSYENFRGELITSLAQEGANVDRLKADAFWQSFIQYYSAVIRDCPLEAKSTNTQLVSCVTCLAWPEEQANAIFPGKRVIQWNWDLKSGTGRNAVCALV